LITPDEVLYLWRLCLLLLCLLGCLFFVVFIHAMVWSSLKQQQQHDIDMTPMWCVTRYAVTCPSLGSMAAAAAGAAATVAAALFP